MRPVEESRFVLWYAIASLTPTAFLGAACLWGGIWPLLALLSVTGAVYFMDRLNRLPAITQSSGLWLCYLLAAAHVLVLWLGVIAMSADGTLDLTGKVMTFAALGLFLGQVSNSNAHELIHAKARWPRRLGALIFCTLGHGHHVSAHLHVHHVHAATDDDPNSARLGEGFWRFWLRAAPAEFMAGLRAETRRHRGKPLRHPYVIWIGGAAISLLLSYALAGMGGVLIHAALAAYAQWQLLLSDYVQHYGLRRTAEPNGKAEPMGPQHSWNAPQWYSSAMMLNAPRHSDHHLRPARPFPALEVTPDTMPVLPRSLPVMASIALIPPLWHRMMDHRAARWQNAASAHQGAGR
jgi:alkane 1-monooxygenase